MKWSLLLLGALLTPSLGWSWGIKGHKIVALIAQNRLTPEAKLGVKSLLGRQDLAAVATWADDVRSEPDWMHTKPWHYLDMNDDETMETMPEPEGGHIVQAIDGMIEALQDATVSKEEKKNALMFLVHFMGDIHQPLHVGRRTDHGGNSISVTFEKKVTNLHALWDTVMIETEGMSYKEYAEFLEGQSKAEFPEDKGSVPFKQIVSENRSARQQIYDFAPLAYAPVFIHESYVLRNRELLHARLLTGGKRLANLLNQLFR